MLVVTALATLLGRLYVLQVSEGPDFARAASANRVRDVVVPAVRGEIVDARGRPLIRNRTALVVAVDRSLPQRREGRAVLARLAGVLDQPVERLTRRLALCGTKRPDGTVARAADECWAGSPYEPVPVAQYDVHDPALGRVLAVEEQREQFPGVTAQFRPVRDYPEGSLAAHVLGYLGPLGEAEADKPEFAGVAEGALVGRAGVEQRYERELRGVDGVQQLLVDKTGTVTGSGGSTAAVPGATLVLSLDAGVQALAERELAQAVKAAREQRYYRGGGRTRADSGSVVVMEARTGRVLALASTPSYDPAQFTGGISARAYDALLDADRGAPLLFRATQGAYAPASTFKVVSAAAAVEEGQADFETPVDCPGVFDPTGQTNFEAADLGRLTLRTAIVRSCDTNFYKYAFDAWLRDGGLRPVREPRDPVLALAAEFGLGRRTGVDLPAESPGLLPTRAWRQEYWEALRADFCAGADDQDFSAARRARNRDACTDGFRYRGGQATNVAIGQGELLVTPLQLARVYAAIANGGRLVRPSVARAVLPADGRGGRDLTPRRADRVPVRAGILAQLRDALAGVTTEPGGTAQEVFAGLPLAVAGKTGTGQVAGKQDTSWFASFAPADDPQLVVVAQISQGGTGATTAAPLVREVYEGIYGLDGRRAALPGGRLPDRPPDLQRPAPPAAP